MIVHVENEDRYKRVLSKIAQNFTELFIYLFTVVSDLHKSTQRQFFKPINIPNNSQYIIEIYISNWSFYYQNRTPWTASHQNSMHLIIINIWLTVADISVKNRTSDIENKQLGSKLIRKMTPRWHVNCLYFGRHRT